ncbi:MAG: hypothetical protein N2486_03195 [Caloramator sp.]|nr:hypothetical protein [Caloramator sp.]
MKLSKNKMIFIILLVLGLIVIPEAIKEFDSNNIVSGVKLLLFSLVAGIISLLYLLSEKKILKFVTAKAIKLFVRE